MIKKWDAKNAYDENSGDGSKPAYPSEYMVRIFASSYFSKIAGKSLRPGMRVIEVGAGFSNQLRFFLDRGLEGVAVDVNPEMCKLAKSSLEAFGYPKTQVIEGTNDCIPVDDEKFDILLSMRALHYQRNEQEVHAALKEFGRVLKVGGICFIQTTGPKDEFRATAIKHAPLSWRVNDYNFRSGDDHGFFDDEAHLNFVCSKYFSTVETGRLTEEYPSGAHMDHLIAVCRK